MAEKDNTKDGQVETPDENQKAKIGESSLSFFMAVLAVLSVRWLLFEPYVIPSGSMIPTLLVHDHILVNKFAYGIRLPFSKSWLVQFSEPKRGDIVVFRSVDEDGKFMIKRVVGVPGDTIEYRDDGRLIVNGQETPHTLMPDPVQAAKAAPFYPVHSGDIGMDLNQVDFFKDQLGENTFRSLLIKDSFRWRIPTIKVGEGKFFMMGDNRDNSKDSRSWGEMPKENLLGKAMFVWLSCESTLPVVDFLCNPLSVRWGRFFQPIE